MAFHAHRLLTLILTSVVGLIVSLTFLQFSAPDLALTQISVEVVTTILLLLALNLLPKLTPVGAEPRPANRATGRSPAAAGSAAAALAYAVMTRDVSSISAFHLAESKPGGGGTNVVNVILVDFRGFDTFGEIIVLCIAALVIYALLDNALRRRRGAAARRDAAALRIRPTPIRCCWSSRPACCCRWRSWSASTSSCAATTSRAAASSPGLVVAIAIIMQFMASGYAWAAEQRRIDGHRLLGAGVLIAAATGIGAFLFGRPFLTSYFGYVPVPLIGEVELATAILFDLGVFLDRGRHGGAVAVADLARRAPGQARPRCRSARPTSRWCRGRSRRRCPRPPTRGRD